MWLYILFGLVKVGPRFGYIYIFLITNYIIVKNFSSNMVFDCSLGFLDYIWLNFVEFLGP